MDHTAFIRSLPDEVRRDLNQKSDAAGLGQLAWHLGLIAFLATLIFARVPGWPIAMLPLGILIVFLFTLLHETSHQTAFASGWLNTWIARLCAFAIALPPVWFRYFHFAHHRHTHDPENDPELREEKPKTWFAYFWHISGLRTWAGHFKVLLINAAGQCGDDFLPARAASEITREARVMLAGYAAIIVVSIALKTPDLLFVWVVPALLGQPFLRLYLMAEHGRCPHVANMFENTRTTFTTAIISRLAWNMPFHAEHHAMPTVPFHRLPSLHQLTSTHLRETENGYLAFHRKYAAELD